jgi:CBS domain-containing protein
MNQFDNFPVKNVLDRSKNRPIVTCHESEPLHKVLETMSKENIQAIPIYRNNEDYSGKIYNGIVSVHEILSHGFFNEIFDQDTFTVTSSMEGALNKFKKDVFFSNPILKVLNHRQEPAPSILSAQDSITELIKLFSNGHHRVLVVATDVLINSPIGPLPAESSIHLISQMDLLEFFYRTGLDETKLPKEFVEKIFTLPLVDIKKENPNVIAINDFQAALAAFNIMHINNVHALPVLNTVGTVISTISATDLRGLSVDNIDKLLLPCHEFLDIENSPAKHHSFDTANTNKKIEEAVKMMVEGRIHHVWVTKDNHLAGCITPTDIFRLFIQ